MTLVDKTDILNISIWLNYNKLFDNNVIVPNICYKGDYIKSIASDIKERYHNKYQKDYKDIIANIDTSLDDDKYIDNIIANAKKILAKDYQTLLQKGVNSILKSMKKDLSYGRINYDYWFFESSLHNGDVQELVDKLLQKKVAYKKDNTIWFNSTSFGDTKDRVLIRKNSQPTYFASDVAYHNNKFERNFDKIINIWGADHHGYIERIMASLSAFSYDKNKLEIILVQFVKLIRDGENVSMSTRSGDYITFNELLQEIGVDATRFFYVIKQSDQNMDFNLSLAKSKSMENPVYYVQYAYARITQIEQKIVSENIIIKEDKKLLYELNQDNEIELMTILYSYPEVVITSCNMKTPHKLAFFLTKLAQKLHSYYNDTPIIKAPFQTRNARVLLLKAVKRVIKMECL